MSTQGITGAAMLLAIALLAQNLRLIFPIPPQVSMFLIGSVVSATLVLATWRYGLRAGLLIAWVTPVVAYLQGVMLPFWPAIVIIGLASSVYVGWAKFWQGRHQLWAFLVTALLSRLAILYGGFTLLLTYIHLPAPKAGALLFAMGWPQLVTGGLGIALSLIINKRLPKV